MTFDSTLTLGNLITVASVLVSLFTLMLTLRKDRRVREREVADRARSSASEALTGLLEWRETAVAFYLSLDTLFIEASRLLLAGASRQEARDSLWKSVTDQHEKFRAKASEGDPIAKFAGMLSYDPTTYDALSRLLTALRSTERREFLEFVETTQDTMLNAPTDLGAAPVDNQLRRDCNRHQRRLVNSLRNRSAPAEELLKAIIGLTDRELLSRASLPDQVERFIKSEPVSSNESS